MTRSRDVRPYLEDIADSIARVRRYTDGLGMDEFLYDDVLQDAVIRRIEIVGEAVGRLPESLKARYPEIPWRDIKDMRNKLIHDYGHVDPQLVWVVVQDELPALDTQICQVIRESSGFMPNS